MATKRHGGGKTKFTVEGKSIDYLLKWGSRNLNNYTPENLRMVVSRLASAANKRLKRSKAAGDSEGISPAVAAVDASGGKFSVAGKDHQGLKEEFLRVKSFLTDPTSTREGWRRAKRKAEREAQRLGVLNGGSKPPGNSGGNSGHPWIFDPETETYSNDDYTGQWEYDRETGFFTNLDSGEIVEQVADEVRFYHDYDTTEDYKTIYDEDGNPTTETGELWRMVDSIAKMHPEYEHSINYTGTSLRSALFNYIDNLWVSNPGMSFEDARDYAATELDKIKSAWESQNLGEKSRTMGLSDWEGKA